MPKTQKKTLIFPLFSTIKFSQPLKKLYEAHTHTHTHHACLSRLLSIFLLWVFSSGLVFGQTPILNPESEAQPKQAFCGTAEGIGEEELQQTPWADNNQYLVEYLRNHGIDLPADYIDQIKNAEITGEGYEPRTLAWEETHQTDNQGRSLATGMLYVPIKAWIHSRDNGTGGRPVGLVEQDVVALNAEFAYSNVPITFYLKCDIGYVANSRFYDQPDQNALNDMWGNYRDGQAVNVHFVGLGGTSGSIGGAQWAGIARRSSITDYLFHNPQFHLTLSSSASATTFAHEMGHALGLLHTHNARDFNGGGVLYNTHSGDCYQEPVSRTRTQGITCISTWGDKKAEVNGDTFIDTPGDPVLYDNTGSHISYSPSNARWYYSGALQDRWGDTWVPDVYNMMGYGVQVVTGASQTSTFTPMQSAEMYLLASLVSTPGAGLAISGPSAVCSGTYSFSVSPSFACTWTVPAGWGLSGQGSANVSITVPSGTSGGYYNVTARTGCGYIAATYRVQVGSPPVGVTGPSRVCHDQSVIFSVPAFGGAVYQWFAPPGWSISSPTNASSRLDVGFNAVSGLVGVSVTSCGGTTTVSKQVNVRDVDDPYCARFGCRCPDRAALGQGSAVKWRAQVLPNPATDRLRVQATFVGTATATLLDGFGRNVRQQSWAGPEPLDMSLAGLLPGLYLLRVSAGQQQSVQHVELR